MAKFVFQDFPLHIYPRHLFVCKGGEKEDVESLFTDIDTDKQIVISEEDVESSKALTFKTLCNKETGDYGVLVWFISKPNESMVAHESLHVISILMNDLGIRWDVENDEPMAYLIGYVVECINKVKWQR